MMNKIEKLLDLCIKIAEGHLEAELKKTHPMLPFPAGPQTHLERAEEAAAIKPAGPEAQSVDGKKTRKPRAPKVETIACNPEAAMREELAADTSVEDQLGDLGDENPKQKELTEEESKARMEEVTKQFVSLCKNDTPEDGKTRAIALMRGPKFGVAKLGELTHAQRIQWIAEMEKGIQEHK